MTFCQSRMQKNTWHSQLTAFYQAGTACGSYIAIRHHIVHSPLKMLLSKPKLALKGNHVATFSVADKTHHWSAGQDEVSLASPQLSLQRFSADKAASAAHLYTAEPLSSCQPSMRTERHWDLIKAILFSRKLNQITQCLVHLTFYFLWKHF